MQPTLNGNRQVVPVRVPHNTCFFATGRVQIHTASRSVQPFLCSLLQEAAVHQNQRSTDVIRPHELHRSLCNANAKFKAAEICWDDNLHLVVSWAHPSTQP